MDAARVVCLIILVAVPLNQGAAQSWLSPALQQLQTCTKDSLCPGTDQVIACVEKIDPANDEEQRRLENALQLFKTERDACPGKCVYAVMMGCMGDFYDKKFGMDERSCNEITKATKCLVKVGTTCKQDVFLDQFEELSDDADVCSLGHGNDDQSTCSNGNILNCTVEVFSQYKDELETTEEGYLFIAYKCDPSVVSETRKCLASFSARCPRPNTQWKIHSASQRLDKECPDKTSH